MKNIKSFIEGFRLGRMYRASLADSITIGFERVAANKTLELWSRS